MEVYLDGLIHDESLYLPTNCTLVIKYLLYIIFLIFSFEICGVFLDVLALYFQATQEELKASYRRLCMLYHPDKHRDPELKRQAEQLFNLVHQAYEGERWCHADIHPLKTLRHTSGHSSVRWYPVGFITLLFDFV